MRNKIIAIVSAIFSFVLIFALATSAEADTQSNDVHKGQKLIGASSVDAGAVNCPSGEVAQGGGFEFPNTSDMQVLASVPGGSAGNGDQATQWVVEARNNDATSHTIDLWVVCGPA